MSHLTVFIKYVRYMYNMIEQIHMAMLKGNDVPSILERYFLSFLSQPLQWRETLKTTTCTKNCIKGTSTATHIILLLLTFNMMSMTMMTVMMMLKGLPRARGVVQSVQSVYRTNLIFIHLYINPEQKFKRKKWKRNYFDFSLEFWKYTNTLLLFSR